MTLRRSQKTWIVLEHAGQEEKAHASSLHLGRGATSAHRRLRAAPARLLSRPDAAPPAGTGFELKYAGPDDPDAFVPIPLDRLIREAGDTTLDDGIQAIASPPGRPVPRAALHEHAPRYPEDVSARLQGPALHGAIQGYRPEAVAEFHQSEAGLHARPPGPVRRGRLLPSRWGERPAIAYAADFDFNLAADRRRLSCPVAGARPARAAHTPSGCRRLFDWWEHCVRLCPDARGDAVRPASGRPGCSSSRPPSTSRPIDTPLLPPPGDRLPPCSPGSELSRGPGPEPLSADERPTWRMIAGPCGSGTPKSGSGG